MALFVVASRQDPALRGIVRARCLSCARDVMVQNAGAEGTELWRNPALSTVELVQETGKPALLMKGGNQ